MSKLTEQQIHDEYQEIICKLCEELIIEGSSISSTFLCEGRFCDRALEMFLESSETCEVCKKLIHEGTGDEFLDRSDGHKFWMCNKCIEEGDMY
jgi:RNase P subunit RPR2